MSLKWTRNSRTEEFFYPILYDFLCSYARKLIMWQLIRLTVCFSRPSPVPKGEKNARSTSHVNHSKALIFSRPLCLNIFFQVHPGWMLRCPYYDRHTHTRTTTPSMITKLFYSSPRGALTIYINFGNPPLFFQILYVCKIASHVCAGVRLYNHVF